MKKRSAALPYIIWSSIFVVVPMFLVLFLSFTESGEMVFTFSNYKRFFEPVYFKILIRSIKLAFQATVLCLLIGYPLAMILSELSERKRNLLVPLFILPMWMNFLLRTYAWLAILGKNGFINKLLAAIGIQKLSMLYTDGAVLLGMVYNFLPFMVLPIYTVLIKMDKSIMEAAKDLGASSKKVFTKIILPLSMPGVMSGITMVFMPSVTTFIISRLLGGGQYMLVGNLIEQQFLVTDDWNFGSAISIIMIVVILISMAFMSKTDKEDGRGLW